MSNLTVRETDSAVELDYERLGTITATATAAAGTTGHLPLIWGHGLTSSRAQEDTLGLLDWARITATTPVVRYDARGHGLSGSTADPATYHWRELARDQLALADGLEIDRYIAGGASMGCATALHVADLAPDRVAGLLLVIPPTAWESRAAQQQNYETMAGLVDAGRAELLIAGAAATPAPDPFVETPSWRDGFATMIRSADPVRLARVFRGAAVTDLPPQDAIAQLRMPTLILAWTGDAGHPISTAERLAQLMPHARLVTASTSDQLQEWTAAATEFLATVRVP